MARELPPQDASLIDSASWRTNRPASLYAALVAGELVDHGKDGARSWRIDLVELGEIALDTGELVVCDPYVSVPDHPPFTRRLSDGPAHAAVVARAEIAPSHQRIAGIVLIGSGQRIQRWELAVQPGHAVETLDDDGYFGFPVDAGTGCVGSPSSFAPAAHVLADDGGMLDDPLSRALAAADGAVIANPSHDAVPVLIFTTGWGDGLYPTWFGVDIDDRVSVVIVDCLLNSDEPPAATDAKNASTEPGLPPPTGRIRRLFKRRP